MGLHLEVEAFVPLRQWLGPPGLVQQGVAVPGVGGVVPQDADAEHEARLIQNLRNIVGEDWI